MIKLHFALKVIYNYLHKAGLGILINLETKRIRSVKLCLRISNIKRHNDTFSVACLLSKIESVLLLLILIIKVEKLVGRGSIT